MRNNDIIDIFVSFVDTDGGKARPVLIVKMTDDKVWILKITSKYSNKSPNIRKYYFPILNWRKYGLDKESYIDTKSYLIAKLKDLDIIKVRGHLSTKDVESLYEFIITNENRD